MMETSLQVYSTAAGGAEKKVFENKSLGFLRILVSSKINLV
jgi:hypothetical protein